MIKDQSDQQKRDGTSVIYLINEVLAVVVCELLCADHTMEIGLHEFLDDCIA